jgi:hypothetical protein
VSSPTGSDKSGESDDLARPHGKGEGFVETTNAQAVND